MKMMGVKVFFSIAVFWVFACYPDCFSLLLGYFEWLLGSCLLAQVKRVQSQISGLFWSLDALPFPIGQSLQRRS